MVNGLVAQGQVRSGGHAQPRLHKAPHLHGDAGSLAELRYLFSPVKAAALAQFNVEHPASLQGYQPFGVPFVAAAFVGHDGNERGGGNFVQFHKTMA